MWFNNTRDQEIKILNGHKNIENFFSVKEERRTREYDVTLTTKQCRLDMRTFEWNRFYQLIV